MLALRFQTFYLQLTDRCVQNYMWDLGVGRGGQYVPFFHCSGRQDKNASTFHAKGVGGGRERETEERESSFVRALNSLSGGLSSSASFREPSVDVARKCWLGADKGVQKCWLSGTCVNVCHS